MQSLVYPVLACMYVLKSSLVGASDKIILVTHTKQTYSGNKELFLAVC